MHKHTHLVHTATDDSNPMSMSTTPAAVTIVINLPIETTQKVQTKESPNAMLAE